jgi:hypothetical protein
MAFLANSNHYISFSSTITGLSTSSFTIVHFSKDDVAVDTATRNSFKVKEVLPGYYYATYIPTEAGFYYLAFRDTGTSTIQITDAADIDIISVVDLTQDTTGVDALKPSLPDVIKEFQGTDLSEYILMVFQSADWQVGRTDNIYAVAMTQLDETGNWLTTPLSISPDTYHLIIRNSFGVTKVFKAFLEV